MKRKASAVLSVGGGQVDENGVELRKKIATPAGKENIVPTPGKDALTQRSSSSGNVIVNVTFTGCNNINYTYGK